MKIFNSWFLLILLAIVKVYGQSWQAVALSDTMIQFGTVETGVEHFKSITITNNLSEEISVLSAKFEEDEFYTDLTPCAIPANSDLAFHVYFQSEHNLDYIDFLKIETDAGSHPLIAEVSAAGDYPGTYYDGTVNLWGSTLKTSLYNSINNHTLISYDEIWNAFSFTDIYSGTTIWDMYAFDETNTADYYYTLVSNQCGNYDSEGDCYNREHSMPKSWFNDSSPMYTDLNHIFATDGYVNNRRGNFPYGEVGDVSWTSTNGSKIGTSSFPGYSGTVFEPIDCFKGDFARGHLYMATRYENVIAGWENYDSNGDAVLNGTSDQVFEDWALQLLLNWHHADPVSQKEINRNNAIYAIQNNRNPFIDHPELADRIWTSTGMNAETMQPEIAVAPSTIDMGRIGYFQTAVYHLAVINTGNTLLTITSINSSNPAFSVSRDESTVSANDYLYVSVSYTSGGSDGIASTQLTIQTNDSDEPEITVPVSIAVDGALAVENDQIVPAVFTLYSAYPNPFNPTTNIHFNLRTALHLEVVLYNLNGQIVESMVNQNFSAGEYHLPVNLANRPTGIYWLSMQAGNENHFIKLLYLK